MHKQINDMLQDIDLQNQAPAQQFWDDLMHYLPKAKGSTKAHHAWEYGYRDHIQEVMNLAYIFYEALDTQRKLAFSLSSALLVLFLHDCEKPFKQASDQELSNFPWITSRPVKSDKAFQELLIEHYGFKISDDEWNALHYVEGEKDDYVHGERVQGPLAAFCHICDTTSARIWFDEPKSR